MRQLSIVALFALFFLTPIDTLAQSEVAKNNLKVLNQNQENVVKSLSKDKASLVISFIKLKLLLDTDNL